MRKTKETLARGVTDDGAVRGINCSLGVLAAFRDLLPVVEGVFSSLGSSSSIVTLLLLVAEDGVVNVLLLRMVTDFGVFLTLAERAELGVACDMTIGEPTGTSSGGPNVANLRTHEAIVEYDGFRLMFFIKMGCLHSGHLYSRFSDAIMHALHH